MQQCNPKGHNARCVIGKDGNKLKLLSPSKPHLGGQTGDVTTDGSQQVITTQSKERPRTSVQEAARPATWSFTLCKRILLTQCWKFALRMVAVLPQ